MEIQIAENIKRFRKEHRLTQEQLAESLGVTVGAVYKWESKQSMPEIKLLIEMAELFETSVDVILGYSWQQGTMTQAAQKIRQYTREKNLDEGLRFAERALKKYPNSFEVVYQSAEAYFLSMNPKTAQRAIDLYRDSIRLINQNPYEDVNLLLLENRIALCYCYQEKIDDAISLFKKNNVEGQNDARIGLILSQYESRAAEALPYLSDALSRCYSTLYNVCIGYSNAYGALKELDKVKEIVTWLYQIGQGIREPGVVTYMDRGDIRIFTILAVASMLQGDDAAAREYLKRGKLIAERFDAAPEYRLTRVKFYHGPDSARAYDDMGGTAMDIILNFINDDDAGELLRPIWEELCHEAE